LNVIGSVSDANIRVETEVHRTANLSRTHKAAHSSLNSNWFKENTELPEWCI
jgi:hypothetical protein